MYSPNCKKKREGGCHATSHSYPVDPYDFWKTPKEKEGALIIGSSLRWNSKKEGGGKKLADRTRRKSVMIHFRRERKIDFFHAPEKPTHRRLSSREKKRGRELCPPTRDNWGRGHQLHHSPLGARGKREEKKGCSIPPS